MSIAKKYPQRIAYGDNPSQFGDLRIPEGKGPFPVVMIIHGGFWRDRFDLEQMNQMADALLSYGIASWNIEYRRVGQNGGGWPGTLQDNASAAEFLKTIVKRYPIDLGRIILVGHSAGGHLALWLAAQHNVSEKSILRDPQSLPEFRSVISLAGVSDLEMMHDIHQWEETLFGSVDNPTRELLEGRPDEYKNRYESSSPHALLPIGIPITLIHGSLDVNVPIGMSEHFQKLATNAGDIVVLKTIPSAEHFQLILPQNDPWSSLLESIKTYI